MASTATLVTFTTSPQVVAAGSVRIVGGVSPYLHSGSEHGIIDGIRIVALAVPDLQSVGALKSFDFGCGPVVGAERGMGKADVNTGKRCGMLARVGDGRLTAGIRRARVDLRNVRNRQVMGSRSARLRVFIAGNDEHGISICRITRGAGVGSDPTGTNVLRFVAEDDGRIFRAGVGLRRLAGVSRTPADSGMDMQVHFDPLPTH